MTYLRTLALLPLFMCSGCIPYHLQETPPVTGSVIDAVTRQPIAGASLHYDKYPNKVVVTAADGAFTFPAIKKWQWVPLGPVDRIYPQHLHADAVGYVSGQIDLAPSDRAILHIFRLDRAP